MKAAARLRLRPAAGLAVPASAAGLHLPLRLHQRRQSFEFPPPGYTLRWFGVAWNRARHLGGTGAIASGWRRRRRLLALLLGTLAAAALARAKFFGREAISLLLSAADRAAWNRYRHRAALGLQLVRFPSRSGRSSLATRRSASSSSTTTRSRGFGRLSPSMVEASMDLGADGFQTFRYIVLPRDRHGAACRRHAGLCAVFR